MVTVDVQVFHDDREIEINASARWLTGLLPTLADIPRPVDGPVDFGAQSCEQLAARITAAVKDRYGRQRQIRTAVLEDGLLGASVIWQPNAVADPGS